MKNMRNEQGTVLVATLMFLMAMGVLATALVFTTQNEMKSSAAYKYSQQALFAADAGVQNAVQWFANNYTANTDASIYDGTVSPVRRTSSAVVLGSATEPGYNYPLQNVGNSFIANVRSKNLTLDPTSDAATTLGRYSVMATLVKYTRVNFIDPATLATTPGAMERWVINSTGNWGPSANNPLGVAQITATIENSGCSLFDRALWGKRYVDLKGVSFIDSYDSRYPYDSVYNHSYMGAIGTNGYMASTNNITVRGDVAFMPGGDRLAAGSTITGSKVTMTTPRDFPPVDDTFVVENGNAGSVNSNKSLALPETVGDYVYGNATVHGDLILGPGTYYFNSITVGGQGRILITGDTKIYVKDGFDVQGGGFVNETGNPTDLDIFYSKVGTSNADTAKLRGSASVNIQFYGPGAPLDLTGGAEYFGSFVADSVDCTGGTAVHFSEGSLTDNIVRRPFKIVTWSQNSY